MYKNVNCIFSKKNVRSPFQICRSTAACAYQINLSNTVSSYSSTFKTLVHSLLPKAHCIKVPRYNENKPLINFIIFRLYILNLSADNNDRYYFYLHTF